MAAGRKPKFLKADYISDDTLCFIEDMLGRYMPPNEEENFEDEFKDDLQKVVDRLDKETLEFGDFSVDEARHNRRDDEPSCNERYL